MNDDTRIHDAGHDYAAAHSLHYGSKDLWGALDLYRSIIARFPDSREAGYSRSQIHNILNAVVPKQTLFDAEVDMALAHCAPTRVGEPNILQNESAR